MSKKGNFVKTAGTIFALVALTHLWIALTNSNINVNGSELGVWINWLAFIVTGYMAIQAMQMKTK